MDMLGRYQLLQRLGEGGMAEVFLAKEQLVAGVSKILVIKKIHPQLAETPQFRQMFEDEAKVAMNLNHPNIVQTFSYGQIGPTLFLAMEHVEGVDLLRLLNAALESGERIPFGLAAYLGQQVAKGLDYAHRRIDEYGEPFGIVHRDISPQNILVSWEGMVKLVDFGIARARHVKEVEGVVKGKFAYMSPEQALGNTVDARSDIFSMGIVLWELATNRTLFGRMSGKHALQAIRSGQIPRPTEVDAAVPSAFEDIILKALAVRPEDRFQTARDLHRALGKFFFELSAKEGQIFESGAMAAFMARAVSRERGTATDPEPRRAAAGPVQRARSFVESASLSTARPVVVIEGDLSGMSALRRTVGESRARELLLDFLRVTENVAYKHGGHTERVDERGFAYIVGLTGGSEEDPLRAIRLALALIEALAGISRDLQPALQLAIGIQRGSALVASTLPGSRLQYQLLGHTTQVARRLSHDAMPGEVLVGGGVYRAARDEYRFEEIESIDLPSESEDDADSARSHGRGRVYRLLGLRPRTERLADPVSTRPLVGRGVELDSLLKAYSAVVSERRSRNVVLFGDAGVGKRSIVDAFRHRLPLGTQVLRVCGRPSLRETPLALVAEIVREALAITEEAEPREIKRAIETAINRMFHDDNSRETRQASEAFGLLLGVKVQGAEEIDPTERRHRLYNAIRKVQRRVATLAPLVIVVEDLHWADPQSYDLFASLLREPIDCPMLAITTARPDDRTESWALDPIVSTVYVSELGQVERRALVDSRFADPEDVEPLTKQILDRAGGNPFFIHELIESFTERGILEADESETGLGRLRWVRRDEAVAVPTTVEAVVASRLDRLPTNEVELLRRASVLGRSFRALDVRALLADPDLDVQTVEQDLRRLCARGFLEASAASGERPLEFSFRNLLTKEVTYGGLAPDMRARLHSLAAQRIEAAPHALRGSEDRNLAEHLIAAGEPVRAATAMLGAAIFARDNASNAEAFRLLVRALELLPPDAYAERYRVHAEREHILRSWGKRPAQLREVHAMRKSATAARDTRGEIEALCRLGLLYLDVGRQAAARRALDHALVAARRTDDATGESEALRLLATLQTSLGKNAEALELARKALAVLDTTQGPPRDTIDRGRLLARAQALQVVGSVHILTGRLREAASTHAECLVIFRRLGARRLEAQTLSAMGWVLVGLGEFEEALLQYKRSLRLAQELGDRAGIGAKLANLGQAYADLGDTERAHRYLGKSLELHTALGDLPGLCDARISLAQVHLKENRLDEALLGFSAGLELATRTQSRYQEIRALIYTAFAELAKRGDVAHALGLARSATALARQSEIANGEVYGLTAEALALFQGGQLAEASRSASAAVALLDSGRDVDSPEEILFAFARIAEAHGQRGESRDALTRAVAEVRRKARRIRDEGWRERYLASPPAAVILAWAAERT